MSDQSLAFSGGTLAGPAKASFDTGLSTGAAVGSDAVRTYVGAGVVWLTEVDIDFEQGGNEASYSGDGYGMQLLAGARYDLGARLFVDASLRYLAGGEVTEQRTACVPRGQVLRPPVGS